MQILAQSDKLEADTLFMSPPGISMPQETVNFCDDPICAGEEAGHGERSFARFASGNRSSGRMIMVLFGGGRNRRREGSR